MIALENNFSLGETLKEIRLKKKLSQEEVALRANITTVYYGLVERNKKNPTVKILEKICYALGTDISDVFQNNQIKDEKFDDITMQILNQLNDRTYEEKKIILNIIRQVFKIKNVK